jgi:site-specific DNA recombinase
MADDRKKLRCAIYTRKSTEEGLEKDFNSLDAQREACAAFILSQSHEGWTQLADRYDDGGFSGGSMVRPALQRLLADVAMGRVDVVVVYKIDRLTRSLADFAKIVETFDAADCSFVSVTQSFNTTSSMGRLTLNVLLSFAQFEREVAAERIRDKIAASKKRGMWMGGPVPLGYEVKERKLIVVPGEACTVRDIMQRYVRSDGVPSLVEELERDGIVGKRRIMRNGSVKGGTPFRRGALAHLLSNRIYLGLITHKGKSYAGKHDAIMDEELFNQVQEKLAAHQSGNGRAGQAASVSILAGRITDRHGRAMPPCHTQNHGKRYRYYASVPRDGSKEAAIRLPAAELEQAVVTTLVSHLRDANALGADLSLLGDEVRQRLFEAANERAEQLSNAQGTKLKQQLALLDLRVSVGADTIEAKIDLGQFEAGGLSNEHGSLLSSFIVPATVKWNGHEPRLKLEPPSGSIARPSDALLDLMSRAFEAREVLLAMTQGDVGVMAPRHRRHLERTAKLSYLAPDIVLAILDGQQPSHLSARKLVRAASLPLDWAAQRRMLLAE